MSGSSRSEDSYTGSSFTGTGSSYTGTRTDSLYSDSLCTEDEAEEIKSEKVQEAPKIVKAAEEPKKEAEIEKIEEKKVESSKEKTPPRKSSKKSRRKSKDKSKSGSKPAQEIEKDQIFKWSFTLDEVYRKAVRFYKDKEGRAFNSAYEDKVKIAALTKQVTYGACANCEKQQEIGYFDWFQRRSNDGNDPFRHTAF
ncbi:unnamed protein product [Oikopleura dioica]|uniref:Uncharacterized protein n=1 Tax=Oikopleura dioica TaxID=34765 RepID=E4WX23_OIKDI|nr:unnamed protein product [Oikopleura dioica]